MTIKEYTINRIREWIPESEVVDEGMYEVRNGNGQGRRVGIYPVWDMVRNISSSEERPTRYVVDADTMDDINAFDDFIRIRVRETVVQGPARGSFTDIFP